MRQCLDQANERDLENIVNVQQDLQQRLGISIHNETPPEPKKNQSVQLPSNFEAEIERICKSTLHPIFTSLPKPCDNKVE
jgi:hypothetical protein